MNEHPNLLLMRRTLDAFSSGDMSGFLALLSDDVVWRVPGTNPLARDYHGRAEVAGFFGELMARTNGSLRITNLGILANDGGGVYIDRLTAERDGRTLDIELLLRVEIADGRIVRGTDHFHHEHQWDDFWR